MVARRSSFLKNFWRLISSPWDSDNRAGLGQPAVCFQKLRPGSPPESRTLWPGQTSEVNKSIPNFVGHSDSHLDGRSEWPRNSGFIYSTTAAIYLVSCILSDPDIVWIAMENRTRPPCRERCNVCMPIKITGGFLLGDPSISP